MRRWLLFFVCALLGLGMLMGGLLVPAHLRAVDMKVIQTAGKNTPALTERGMELAQEKQLGGAAFLLLAAQELALPDTQTLGLVVTNLAARSPVGRLWGTLPPEGMTAAGSALSPEATSEPSSALQPPGFGSEPVTELIVRRENREQALQLLRVSTAPGVQNMLPSRELTRTVLFSPSQSASGQAFDAALALSGLLLKDRQLTASLTDTLSKAALRANYGNDPEPLEQILLDLMSIGKRMNWGQLVAFVGQIDNAETLRLLADQVRNAEAQLPVLFAAVQLSGDPDGVAGYLKGFSQTGLRDLGTSLRSGAGGVAALLRSHKQVSQTGFRRHLPPSAALDSVTRSAATFSLEWPRGALAVKWLLYALGGFFLAAAVHFAKWPVSTLERPLQVRGFHLARETLFALGFLLVVLLLSEPFLAQETQKAQTHFRLRLPKLGGVVHATNPITSRSFMNQINLLTLLLFFVLQALIYTACVIKLAEIRRQKVPPRIKLKLLENEDHLFDAGLYLGFVGTIISLILVSMGIASFSLMAAYSSTSFGIIFVSIFKIFNLRGARRKLLLQAETMTAQPRRVTLAPELTAPSTAQS